MRIGFETLGCRSNFADAVEVQTALIEKGAVISDFSHPADVFVLNTCTVTDGADYEAQKIVRRVRAKYPQSRIVIMGCLAELGFSDFQERSLVDEIVGPTNRSKVIAAILGEDIHLSDHFGKHAVGEALSKNTLGPGQSLGDLKMRARFHLRIQDGCNNLCSYCIVPFVRGKPRSKHPDIVKADLALLCSKGYEEVVLSGTHLGAYGSDLGTNLVELLRLIDESTPKCRIRISSLDPHELSHDIIDFLEESPHFCEHLHLCFQSFSDKLLVRMGRKYTISTVEKNIEYVHKRLARWCIGSDLIVGFPGESREDVDQAIQKFLDLPISYLHVFPYSERKQTKAIHLDGVVPVAERRQRSGIFRQLSTGRHNEYLGGLVGRKLEIVVEKVINKSLVIGTSREYAQCELTVGSAVTEQLKIGSRLQAVGKKVNIENESLICEL